MAHTILLADDSVTVRRVVELTFGGTDIRVESVGSGAAALDRFYAGRPDLVLADVTMPPPTGYDLCRQIKSADRTVPVLLLRGAFESFDEERARECGADGHVVKPFESENLIARVNDLLARFGDEERQAEAPAKAAADEAEAALMDLVEGGAQEAETTEGELLPERDEDEREEEETELAIERPDVVRGETVAVVAVEDGSEPVPVEIRETFTGNGAEPSGSTAGPGPSALTDGDLDTIARAVAERLSEDVVREVAWEVVPELAEVLIKERIRQIENDEEDGG
jgi:DNA-binding response OmpR family regulator